MIALTPAISPPAPASNYKLSYSGKQNKHLILTEMSLILDLQYINSYF